ncbi:MAG: AAC(3) family N-acetyltransferase [Hominenteromicrobium sp.]
MNETETYLSQLRTLGIRPGDAVLVHSSMKAIGTTCTPKEILAVLQAAVGDAGTLLLPALTYENVTPEHPVFDSRTSVPCIGLLPRTFQAMPDVLRSVHPTHSVCARGKNAGMLTAEHILDNTPVGPHSPFMRLADFGGKLLFIGEVVDCCTFMHGLEEIAGVDYVLNPEPSEYIVNGERRAYYTHNFSAVAAQRYSRIKAIPGMIMQTGRLGRAPCYLFDARSLRENALALLRRDPHFFVQMTQ